MDVFYAYTYSTFGWCAIQAAPLIISPTIIVTLLSPEVREPTVLEEYFSRSLGLALFTLGVMVVLLTGSVPLTSSISETADAGVTTEASDPKAPYAVPTLTVTTLYHSIVAFFLYARWSLHGQISFLLGTVGYASLASLGLWIILFATGNGRISRKTGADKRTSGWPFSNKEAASAKKKAARKGL